MSELERLQELNEIIEKYKNTQGALIPVLHVVQEIYGYLPEKALKTVSKELNIPIAEIYGVATFYTRFSLKPKGKYKIGVCLGTACYVKNSATILEKVKEMLKIDVGECTKDGKFSLEATRCVGGCGLAPVMTINEKVYGRLQKKDVEDIINEYLRQE